MASNVAPLYEKQTIRYAQTYDCSPDELFEFRLVWDNNGVVEVQDAASAANQNTLGVSQYYIPSAAEDPAFSRLANVASSGDLLVEMDPANPQLQGDVLLVDTVGRASSAGAAVTLNGTTPTIRRVSNNGGRAMAIVYFS